MNKSIVPMAVGASTSEGLGTSAGHPFFVQVKVDFRLSSSSAISADAWITIDSPGGSGTLGNIKQLTGSSGAEGKQFTVTGTVPPGFTASGFSITLNIQNTGTDTLELKDRRVQVFYSLWGQVLPGLLLIVGLLMTIIGFIRGRKPGVRKPTTTTPGWEPTLQWSGSGGGAKGASAAAKETKKSRFSIRSSKQSKTKQRKVVRKAAPAGGGQIECKFCGKKVAPTAFFCPHCYGKLR